jgi:hypothetical protein
MGSKPPTRCAPIAAASAAADTADADTADGATDTADGGGPAICGSAAADTAGTEPWLLVNKLLIPPCCSPPSANPGLCTCCKLLQPQPLLWGAAPCMLPRAPAAGAAGVGDAVAATPAGSDRLDMADWALMRTALLPAVGQMSLSGEAGVVRVDAADAAAVVVVVVVVRRGGVWSGASLTWLRGACGATAGVGSARWRWCWCWGVVRRCARDVPRFDSACARKNEAQAVVVVVLLRLACSTCKDNVAVAVVVIDLGKLKRSRLQSFSHLTVRLASLHSVAPSTAGSVGRRGATGRLRTTLPPTPTATQARTACLPALDRVPLLLTVSLNKVGRWQTEDPGLPGVATSPRSSETSCCSSETWFWSSALRLATSSRRWRSFCLYGREAGSDGRLTWYAS